ncbi:SRPBCC domain-containing protein [Roseovarius sp. MBR-6]|jgi:uncharacterized protein YndB with AHSA1/START domain|uniref:SRPBCC domain-containing protein n=1 Tax=Roseovarius sp. MBR-6 TaxID=3156459 RepID=UPI0033979B16
MNIQDSAGFQIRLERYIDAPREAVFAEWLDASSLREWFAPAGSDGIEAAADPTPGGRWRVVFAGKDGVRITETGVFELIDKPRRIEFTLGQDLPDGVSSSRVTVDFEVEGKGTRMRFCQTGMKSLQQRDGVATGWGTCFDRLENRLGEAAVRAEFEDWFATSEAKDLDAAMSKIASDIVSFEHTSPLEVRDIEGLRAECAKGFAAAGPEFRWDIPDHRIVVRGDIAVCWGLNRMTSRQDGALLNEMWSRGTRVFQKRDGQWKMIHQHVSFPMDPATGMAATDLDPAS